MRKIILLILMFVLLINTVNAAEGDLKWSYTTAVGSTMNMETMQITKEGFLVFTPEDATTLYVLKPDGTAFTTIAKGAQAGGLNDPVVDENSNIYSYADDGIVYSWTLAGTSRWTRNLVATGNGVVYDGRNGYLYAYDGDKIYALYANNGTSVWNFTTGFGGYTVPSISSDTLYISGYGDGVKAIWKNNGTSKWNYTSVINIMHTPAISIDEKTIYVGIDTYDGSITDGGLLAINASTGIEDWYFNATEVYSEVYQTYASPTILTNGNIVIGFSDPSVFNVYPNGTLNWNISYSGINVFESNIIEHENNNLSYIFEGKLYTANSTTGENTILYNTTYGNRYASVSVDDDGNYYFGVDANKVYAIEGSSPPVYNQTDYTDETTPNNFYVWRNQPYDICSIKTNIQSSFYGSSPAIDHNGNIYIAEAVSSGKLISFYPNLTERWNYTIGRSHGSPLIDPENIIYIFGYTTGVWAFYPNGTLKWNYDDADMDGGNIASMLFDDNGYLYFQDDVYLYSWYNDGSLRYKYYFGDAYSDISIDLSNNIYSSSYYPLNKLFSISQSGTSRWNSSTFSSDVYSSTLSNDGSLVFTQNDHATNSTGSALYTNNGSYAWNYSTGDEDSQFSPFLEYNGNGNLYFKSKNYIHSVYSNNGTLNWKYQDDGNNYDSGLVISSDEKLHYQDGNAILMSLNHDGTLNWKYQLSGDSGYSTPAISTDGHLYVTSKTELYSCNIGSPAMYTLDDFLNNTISNTFILSRHQYSNTTALVQNIVISFSGESISPTLVTPTETSTISIDITTTGVSISTAIVKIAGTNYTMTNTAGNTWQYLFTGHPVGTYDIDNYYAQDHSSKWGSTTSSLSIEVYDDGGGGGPTPTPTVLPTPRPTDQPNDWSWWSGFNDSINQLKITISPLWQSILFMLLSLIIIGYMTKDE